MNEWPVVAQSILGYLAAGVATYIGWEIHRTRDTIAQLNANILVIIARLESQEKRVDQHENRLMSLEGQITRRKKNGRETES